MRDDAAWDKIDTEEKKKWNGKRRKREKRNKGCETGGKGRKIGE